ncbi:MAG: Stf0 family sulfotransferase [Trebonia sp.]
MTGSYLICGTPRTGSTLLCALLDSTGVAGHPESYFRRQGERSYAEGWGIGVSPDGAFDYSAYVRAALTAGSTANGVFGARIMWGTMTELAVKLRGVYPDVGTGDPGLLERAFGTARYIYLWRADVLRQAVSLVRAEQTGFWHDTGEPGQPEQLAPERKPRYDAAAIREHMREIGQHNAAWRAWFAAAGIRPQPVRYEDLDADPAGVTRGILDYLQLDLPPGRVITARNRRLADDVTQRWAERYLHESPSH